MPKAIIQEKYTRPRAESSSIDPTSNPMPLEKAINLAVDREIASSSPSMAATQGHSSSIEIVVEGKDAEGKPIGTIKIK